MTCRHILLSLLPALLLAAGTARAAPLTINESSGDFADPSLPNPPFPLLTNIGTLGIGANTISGNVQGSPNTGGGLPDYVDSFLLSLPSGLVITSANIQITNFDYGTGGHLNDGGINDHGLSTSFTMDNTYTLSPFATAGEFQVTISSPSSYDSDPAIGFITSAYTGNMDYLLTYNVDTAPPPTDPAASAVPLPNAATAALTLLPLALLAKTLRRRAT